MAASSALLVCQNNTHKPITLLHQEPVVIGRSLETRIAEKKVSRQQFKIVADCQARKATVTQLGTHPCAIDEKDVKKGETAELKEGAVLYILSRAYPHTLTFQTDKSKNHSEKVKKTEKETTQKRNIQDFFSKKSSKVNSKRPAIDSSSAADESDSKRRKLETEADVNEMSEDEEEDEHERMVMDRLKKMKEAFQTGTKSSGERRETIPERRGEPCEEAKWTEHERLIVFTRQRTCASSKIAAFDIDGCIIRTKSGKVFPENPSDWKINFPEIKVKLSKLLSNGYKVAFFTNQMGIARGKLKVEDFKKKVEGITKELDIPIQVFVSTGPGIYRKPCLGMWEFLENHKNDGIAVDRSQSFYVGDAAGRPVNWAPGKKKDFACSDRLFALNAGLAFHTPEEYFLGYKKSTFKMPEFDPRNIDNSVELLSPKTAKLTSETKEVIVTVGLPGSGKSHFAKTHFIPKGYLHASRDVLGTWQKCVEKVKAAITQGKSIVVDNTSIDPLSRKRYVDAAKSLKVRCRCFWFDMSVNQCRHNERFREVTDKSHQTINEMIFNQLKSKFKAPDPSEGFTEIVKVKFVPKFSNPTEEKFYKQFLMDK